MHAFSAGDERLVRLIGERIRSSPQRAISFKEYMTLCLYHDSYGYYMRDGAKIGKDGDFYTSAFVGSLMAETLAAAAARYWDSRAHAQQPSGAAYAVTEWGGGTGRLAVQLLDELASARPDLYERLTYTIVDTSPYHRERQRLEADGRHASVLRVMDEAAWRGEPQPPGAVIIANELLDALPVHMLEHRSGAWMEVLVAAADGGDGPFAERLAPCADEWLLAYARRYAPAPLEGQRIEAAPDAGRWISRVADKLRQGLVLALDYGDAAEELYAPHRMAGTLLCYRRHQAHGDPYVECGLQDITAHVNFSACIDAAEAAGFGSRRWMTQKQFLLEHGILDKLQNHTSADPFHPAARRNRAIRQLLVSDQMSELFKVLMLYK